MRCNKYKNLQKQLEQKKFDSVLYAIMLAVALGYTVLVGASIKNDSHPKVLKVLTATGACFVAGTGYGLGKSIKQYKDVKNKLGQNANGIKRSR